MIKPSIANTLLKLFFAQAQTNTLSILPDQCYIGLAKTGNLSADGSNFSTLEPSADAGYKRYLLCARASMDVTNKMTTPTDGSLENKETIFFPKATSAWGEIKYFGLFSSVNGGEPVFWGEIKATDGASVNVGENEVAIFSPGQLKVTLA